MSALRAGSKDIVELIGLLKQCSAADAESGKGGRLLCAGIIDEQVVISAYLRESGYELAHTSF
jgi:hypothetical protein